MNVSVDDLRSMMILLKEQSDGCIEFEDDPEGESGNDLEHYSIEDLINTPNEVYELIIKGNEVRIFFLGEDDYFDFSIAEFMRQAPECNSIKAGIGGTLQTKNLAIQLVSPESEMAHVACYHSDPLLVVTKDKACIQVRYYSIPVAVFATQAKTYESRELGALSAFCSIEVDFTEYQRERTDQVESNLINSYLFELASSQDIIFQKTNFIYEENIFHPRDAGENPDFKFKPLEEANEGIHLYLAATQVNDPKLRFFSFYKVLEHFAPIALNLEVHEVLRKKLDSRKSLSPNAQFIHEILQISKSYDQRKNDKELIKNLLLTSIDLIGLNEKLPASICKPLNYESSRKELVQYANELAECIYATRNQVAHAKATYKTLGKECPLDEIDQLTVFLELAASEVIRWYNRLPEYQRCDFTEI